MLEAHLSLHKVIHLQNIHEELKALKKLDDESMRKYVIKVRALTYSLSGTNNHLQDVDVIDFVAEGLGPEFKPFISDIHN